MIAGLNYMFAKKMASLQLQFSKWKQNLTQEMNYTAKELTK